MNRDRGYAALHPSKLCGALLSMDKQFKKCPKCNFSWNKREDFLSDENVYIIGYEASDGGLVDGLFLFNHDCGTTLALKVEKFNYL